MMQWLVKEKVLVVELPKWIVIMLLVSEDTYIRIKISIRRDSLARTTVN